MRKVLVLTAVVLAAAWTVTADDVASTVHNLSTSGTGTYHADGATSNSTDQICVFCHTPHGASDRGPLWNRAAASAGGGSWTMYSSSTINMTMANAPQGVSNACMSCHDGTTGFDVLVNAPGSGLNGGDQGWTFVGGDTIGAGRVTNFGNDLTGEHPISLTYDASIQGGNEFNAAGADNHVGGLPLYARPGTSTYDQVECGSCHNPHNNSNGTFLRISNSASALCKKCHKK